MVAMPISDREATVKQGKEATRAGPGQNQGVRSRDQDIRLVDAEIRQSGKETVGEVLLTVKGGGRGEQKKEGNKWNDKI